MISAITGAPINETVGTDVNGDGDNNDRPIRGHRTTWCFRSVRGRLAGPRGHQRPAGAGVVPGRPVVPLLDSGCARRFDSLDLFYDIFNLFNRENLVAPTGTRTVGDLHGADGGTVPAADAVRHSFEVLMKVEQYRCARAGSVGPARSPSSSQRFRRSPEMELAVFQDDHPMKPARRSTA